MSEPTEARVREIIVNELGVEPEKVTDDASFVEDLGADSLDTVELVMAFEEEFGIDMRSATFATRAPPGTERDPTQSQPCRRGTDRAIARAVSSSPAWVSSLRSGTT